LEVLTRKIGLSPWEKVEKITDRLGLVDSMPISLVLILSLLTPILKRLLCIYPKNININIMHEESLKRNKLIVPIKTRRRALAQKQQVEVARRSRSPFKAEISSKSDLALFLTFAETSFNALIPPTLITLKSVNKQYFFYYKEGQLHLETDKQAGKHFFELSRDTGHYKYKHPRLIEYTPSGIWLFSSEEEAKQLQGGSEMSLLQRFVHNDKKYSKKLRILWNRAKGTTYWTVKNTNSLLKTQFFTQLTRNVIQHSSYMYKTNEYKHAGRLLKTSFSPFNLYQSTQRLEKKSSSSSIHINYNQSDMDKRKSSININNFNISIHLAKQSDCYNTKNYEETLKNPKLEKIIQNFFEIFDRWTENLGFSPIKKASFDFIEDLKGKWYLVGCKLPGIDKDTYLLSVNLKKVNLNGTVSMKQSNLEEEIKADQEKYKQKFVDIRQRLASIKCSPAHFVESDKSSVISMYKSLPSLTPLQSFYKINSEKRLSPIAELYDLTIDKARELKKRTKMYSDLAKIFQNNEGGIESMLNEIFESLAKSESFGMYLKQSNRWSIAKEFIKGCINDTNLPGKLLGKEVFKDLGVNRRNFQEFIYITNNVLSKHFEENLKDLLLERIIEGIEY